MISELCRMNKVSRARSILRDARDIPEVFPRASHVHTTDYSAAAWTIELRIKSSRSTHITSFEVRQWSIKSARAYMQYTVFRFNYLLHIKNFRELTHYKI